MFLFRSLTIILLFLTSSAYAVEETNIQCQKIVIAGDSQWPPYTTVATNDDKQTVKISGLGIEIAKRIFAELDVPIEEFAYNDQMQMMQGLRDGEIDLIVSTYNTSGITHDAILLQPAYILDPITVAEPIAMSQKIISWDDLAGLNGVQISSFTPDDRTSDFIGNYLHIPAQESLLTALQAVKNGTSNYVIGSDLQLSYAIQKNQLNHDLLVMRNLHKGGDVHMAFAKNSVCKQYAIYVQKRLQDYKNNGTVEKVLKKYIY